MAGFSDRSEWRGEAARGLALACLAAAAFAACAALKFHSPLAEWDYFSVSQAVTWAGGGKFFVHDHPPLYPLALSAFSGAGAWIGAYRAFNLAGVILTAALLYLFCRRRLERGPALAASALYLLTPAVIQGVSLLDYADASWLPFSFMLFLLLSEDMGGRKPLRFAAAAGAAALCFSLKTTSSGLLLASLAAAAFLSGRGQRLAAVPRLLAFSCGGAAAVVFWRLTYPYFYGGAAAGGAGSIALGTVLERLDELTAAPGLLRLAVYAATMIFWFNPYLLRLAFEGAARPGGLDDKWLRFHAVTLGFYFLGYLLLGGLNHGYPRYHMAIWPLAVGVTAHLWRSQFSGLLGGGFARSLAFALAASIPLVLLPDPIRLLNLDLREALLYGTGLAGVAARLAAWAAALALLPAALKPFCTEGKRQALIISALACLAAAAWVQARAPYMTSYEYGASGKPELAAEFGVAAGEGKVYAVPGLLYYLSGGKAPSYGGRHWSAPAALADSIIEGRPEAVLMGPGVNTLWQLRLATEDGQLRRYLEANYESGRVGTFLVWRKKGTVN